MAVSEIMMMYPNEINIIMKALNGEQTKLLARRDSQKRDSYGKR